MCFIYLFLCFAYINCLQVIPERGSVTYFNELYLHNASGSVRRYGRRSPYYINVEGTTKHTWGNNVTINLIFFEYLHNEYKRSFVEMHFKACDMIKNDPYTGRALAAVFEKLGLSCPTPPCTEIIPERAQVDYYNKHYLTNVSAYIKRYARRSPYYINVEGTAVRTLGYDITLHGVFYEYLHNEYKQGFVGININMCDLFHKNPWKNLLGAALVTRGATCPAPPVHNLY